MVGAIVICGGCFIQRERNNQLRAQSPAGALVEPTDSIAVVRAKNLNYDRTLEAVRIFHELLLRDNQVPILPETTRKEIETFLHEFYQNKPQ